MKKNTIVTCDVVIDTFKVVCVSRQSEIEMIDLWDRIKMNIKNLTFPENTTNNY